MIWRSASREQGDGWRFSTKQKLDPQHLLSKLVCGHNCPNNFESSNIYNKITHTVQEPTKSISDAAGAFCM